MQKDMLKRLTLITATLILALALCGSVSATSDIGVTKTVNNSTPNVGDTVNFTITVTNNGPDEAAQVYVQDYISTASNGLQYVSHSASQGTYDPGTGLWNITNFANGATATLILEAYVNQSGNVTNIAAKIVPQPTAIGGEDPNPANDMAAVILTVPPAADVQITKWVNNTLPNIGDFIRFYIQIQNNGPDNATNVVVNDTIPFVFSFSAPAPGANVLVNGGVEADYGILGMSTGWNGGNFSWNIGTIIPGGYLLYYFDFYLNNTTNAGQNFTNTATLISTTPYDWNSTNNQSSAEFRIPAVDISFTKTVNDSSPNVGDTIVFTLTITNNGPDYANNVWASDNLPSGLQLVNVEVVSYFGVDGIYFPENPFLTQLWMEPGGYVIFNIFVTILPEAANQTIVNNWTLISVDEYDTNSSNNNSNATVDVPPAADIAVEKTVDNSTPNYHDVINWTITVTNNGPDDATNVNLSDLLPAGMVLQLVTPSQGTYDNVTGVWSVGTLTNGSFATLVLQALVNATGNITNTANASATQYDWNMSNNHDNATIEVPYADLAIIKTVDDSTPNYRDIVTFKVTVTNNGPYTAVNTLVSDLLGPGFSLIYATPYLGSYDNVTGVWTVGDLANGASATLVLVAQVLGHNTTLNNTANVSSETWDWDMTNNNVSVELNIPPAVNLGIIKEAHDTPFKPSPVITTWNYMDQIIFWMDVTNYGPDTATGVQFTEVLPPGLEFVSYNTHGVGSFDPLTGIRYIGNINPGQTVIFDLIVRVVGHNATITNNITVTGNEYDYAPDNNTATSTITVLPAADIAVTKTVNDATPNYLDIVTFTVNVTNNGPDTAVNTLLSDLLDSGFSFVSATASHGSYNSTTGVWTIGDLANGTSATLTLLAQVLVSNITINNYANASSETYDWNMTNNEVSVNVDVPPAADIGVDKRVSNNHPLIGDTITWTIFVTNYGPDDANDVEIYDMISAGLTYVSYSSTQGIFYPGASNWNWVIGNMSALSVVRLDITTIVNPANGSANVTNNASVLYVNEYDWYAQNDNSSATIYLPVSDLSITKSADKTSINVGEDVLWTVTLTNNGPFDATNIVVTDLLSGLPTWYNINSVTPSVGTFDNITGTWTINNLSYGGIVTLVINMTALAPSAGQNIVNTANVTSLDQYDPSNATSNATVYVKAVDVVVNKTVNNSTPNYRSNVTFTVTAHNNGPDNATGVVVTDLLPAGMTLVSATTTVGSYNNATGVWTIGNLNNGATATLTLVAQVMDANKTLTNMANLTAVNEYDANPANNGSSVDIVIPASADIAVTKTTNSSSPLVCENFQWTITVTNNGPNDATGVVITDLLPAGLNFVSATASQGTYNAATGVWTVGTVVNGSTATLVIVTNATSGLSGVVTTNTATKTAETQYDWNTSNNVGSASITVPAKKTFTLYVKNTGTGRIHAIYYVTVYQPCNAAPIYKKYEFYLNAGQSVSFNVGTYAVGTAISTDEFVYNAATSMRTVSLTNTWTATGLPAYTQYFKVYNVPANQAKAALARKRFWINRNSLDVLIVRPPALV